MALRMLPAVWCLCVILLTACSGGSDSEETPTPEATSAQAAEATTTSSATPTPSITSTPRPRPTQTPRPTSTPRPSPTPLTGNRLRIPSLGINAAFAQKPVPETGFLPEPNDHDSAVLYDFSVFPGLGGSPGFGNAVFAGDLDSLELPCLDGTLQRPCGGVFWFLHELAPGDAIAVDWQGEEYEYIVESLCWIDRDEDFGPYVASPGHSVLTLLTAAGDYGGESYTHRLLVRASTTGNTASMFCSASSSVPRPTVQFSGEGEDVESITASSLMRGAKALVLVQTTGPTYCIVEMRHGDGTPVFAAVALPIGSNVASLEFRVWERLEDGMYSVTADCGNETKTVEVELTG